MKKSYGCLIAGLVAALVFSLGLNILLSVKSAVSSVDIVHGELPLKQRILQRGDGKDSIARISVEGVISSMGGGVDGVKRALKQALSDDHVKAVLLYVNSPGGEVTASDTIYHAVKQTNAKKPVVVYMDSLAASGGYYISCGATKIVANETTLTGSIGVIMQSINYSQLMGKVGLDAVTFRSGDFKDTLSGSRPMREDERKYVQSLVTQMYDKFAGIVSDARGIPVDTLKNGVADGRIVTGADALKENLIDQTGYIEDAYTLAASLGGISGTPRIVEYLQPGGLFQILDFLGQSNTEGGARKVEIDVSERLLPGLEPGRAYYLPGFYAR